MQSNSQGRRDRPDQKLPVEPDKDVVQTKLQDSHVEANLVGETPVETKSTIIPGIVTDCLRLNIRKEPNLDAEVLTVIDLLSEVIVDMAASTKEFYKVTTSTGVEGFCLKKHIALPR